MKNLTTRIIFGLLYVALLVGGLLLHPFAFLAVMLFALIAMMVEFHRITVGPGFAMTRSLSILTGVTFFVLVFLVIAFDASAKFLAIALVPLVAMFISTFKALGSEDFLKITGAYASLIYVVLPLSVFNIAEYGTDLKSGMLLLGFFIIVMMSDIGAYVFGMLLGQKYGPKLCPTISPKKSWIGVGGGILFGIGSAIALKYIPGFIPESFTVLHCAGLGLVLVVFGILGDLMESVWKRNAGVKDSGNLIPGHGGMLDRLDSALIAVPMATVYLIVTNLI